MARTARTCLSSRPVLFLAGFCYLFLYVDFVPGIISHLSKTRL